ncbi:ParA family protein [Paraeggerthella hongkongensis]|uniref:AAA domain-containing protein n=1 Tax=Paraeggerthella hongkongensis TaxID=230658 RepID=A0A3N0AUN8_9ACTN|nr:hypothetical protein DMP08_12090 [Paraeggerthella hongkongensis]
MHSCKTIAIVNQREGVVKDAITTNLGIGLAIWGRRVPLVNTNPQGNLTTSLDWQEPDGLNTTIVNRPEVVSSTSCILPTKTSCTMQRAPGLMPASIGCPTAEI